MLYHVEVFVDLLDGRSDRLHIYSQNDMSDEDALAKADSEVADRYGAGPTLMHIVERDRGAPYNPSLSYN